MSLAPPSGLPDPVRVDADRQPGQRPAAVVGAVVCAAFAVVAALAAALATPLFLLDPRLLVLTAIALAVAVGSAAGAHRLMVGPTVPACSSTAAPAVAVGVAAAALSGTWRLPALREFPLGYLLLTPGPVGMLLVIVGAVRLVSTGRSALLAAAAVVTPVTSVTGGIVMAPAGGSGIEAVVKGLVPVVGCVLVCWFLYRDARSHPSADGATTRGSRTPVICASVAALTAAVAVLPRATRVIGGPVGMPEILRWDAGVQVALAAGLVAGALLALRRNHRWPLAVVAIASAVQPLVPVGFDVTPLSALGVVVPAGIVALLMIAARRAEPAMG